ncbi:phosphoribosylglycinamide formyltransferase [Nocardia sp. NPDC003693]
MRQLRVGVLVSHTGSNLRALHRASLEADAGYEIVAVVSNNSGSLGLAYARDNDIPTRHLSGSTHPNPEELDDAIRDMFVGHSVDLLITAGYMKKLGPRTRAAFAPRIINVHPALLPLFGGHGMFGAHVHRAVLDAGAGVSGPTVHFVADEYDTGSVIAQLEVPVLADDTVESLAARVLVAEHELLPRVVREIAAGQHLGGDIRFD